MSVINKKEFLLLWAKQTMRNLAEKYSYSKNNALACELLKEN